MEQISPSDRTVNPQSPLDLLGRFYPFLLEVDQALKVALDDISLQDSETRRVIALVEPLEPIFDDSAIPDMVRRLLEKAPPGQWLLSRLKRGIGEAVDPRFATGLMEHISLPLEYTKTLQLFEVFRRYSNQELATFQRLLDIKLEALKRSYFSDDTFKHWRVANVGVAVALAAGWSALLSTLLGADVFATLLNYIARLVRESLVVQIIGWCVFLGGLLGIWLWSLRRYANTKQTHRLARAQSCLGLFLESATGDHASHRKSSADHSIGPDAPTAM
jgi:hypothetical protein